MAKRMQTASVRSLYLLLDVHSCFLLLIITRLSLLVCFNHMMITQYRRSPASGLQKNKHYNYGHECGERSIMELRKEDLSAMESIRPVLRNTEKKE